MQHKHRGNGKKIKREFFDNKYCKSYYNDRPLMSKLMYYNNTAVAHVGAFPMTTSINHKTLQILQIGDIITHSDHIGKGLFSQLIKAVIMDAKEKGYAFLFVVPNSNALPIFVNKFNWKQSQKNVVFSRSIQTVYLNKIFNKLKLINLYSKIFDFFNKKYIIDRDIETVDNKKDIDRIFKDSAFYRYKVYSKNYLYKFNHGNVWFKLDDGMLIGDLPCKMKSIDKLMRDLIVFAKRRGIHNLKIHQSTSSPYYNYFKKGDYSEDDSLPVLTYRLDKNLDLSNWLTCMSEYNTF